MANQFDSTVSVAKRIRRGLLHHLYAMSQHNFYEMPIKDFCSVNPNVKIDYRFGAYADIEKLGCKQHDYDEEAKDYARERIQAGDIVVVGEHKGEIAFYCWVCFGEIELGYRKFIAASSDSAFVYKVFVVDGLRGQRVYPAVYGYLASHLMHREISRVMTQTNVTNTASDKSIRRCGYRLVGNYRCVRILGFRKYFVGRETLACIAGRITSNKETAACSSSGSRHQGHT